MDSTVRIWRIRRDYATADLRREAAEEHIWWMIDTSSRVAALRERYRRDWSEWPWEKGAPFYDRGYIACDGRTIEGRGNNRLDWGEDADRDGILDPGEDCNGNGRLDAEAPGFARADLVIWYAANDLTRPQLYDTLYSGVEVHHTIWAYARSGPLGDAIFKRYRLFYKGVASTPPDAIVDSLFITHFADADIGDRGNDFAGVDIERDLAYTYNAVPTDGEYARFGLAPPAVGYLLLQGPIVPTGSISDTAIVDFRRVPGWRNKLPSAFYRYASRLAEPEPLTGDLAIRSWYQVMRGLPPQPVGPPDPPPFRDPTTGLPTHFMTSGDPLTGTGWVDGIDARAGDRRTFLSTGPVSIALGDSQEVIIATVLGLGSTNLNSVAVLRSNADAVRAHYRSLLGPGGTMEEQEELPQAYALSQNYPNPFNPSTTIEFAIPRPAQVRLAVYDILGREVTRLVDGFEPAGFRSVRWDAAGRASGVYFCRLTAGEYTGTIGMVLVR